MEGDNGVKNMNVIKGDEKEEIKSELNDQKDGLAEEVEEKIGDCSGCGGERLEPESAWEPGNLEENMQMAQGWFSQSTESDNQLKPSSSLLADWNSYASAQTS